MADNLVTLSVAQYLALGTVGLPATDIVTLADTGAALGGLSVGAFGLLASRGIDRIDATDNVLTLSVARYRALGTVELTGADTVTLADTASAIAALTAADFAALAGKGIDLIDSTGNALILTVAQYLALGTVTLTSADTVTLADTGATLGALSVGAFALLGSKGIDRIDATDNVLTLSVARYQALGTVALTAGDTVTLADTAAAIAALTAADFAAMAGKGIDRIDSTSNSLILNAAQYQALGTIVLTAADTVTLSDAGAAIAALTVADFAALAGKGVDRIDATNNALTISLAQYQALGAVALTASDTVTLADTGAALGALSVGAISLLGGKGIDRIDATDDVLALSVARYQALGPVALTAADTVTLADTGAAIAALTAADIGALTGKRIDVIDATNNALTISLAQYQALGAVALTAADTVILADTAAAIGALSLGALTALAGKGIDRIDVTENVLSLSVARYQALGPVGIVAADSVTLADTGGALAALTAADIAAMAGKGIDRIDSTSGVLMLSVAQYVALGPVALTAEDTVVLADTGAAIGALSSGVIGGMASRGVDRIDATDNVLALSVAQYQALGTVGLTSTDTVTLADAGVAIGALSIGALGGLASKGIDKIDATDDDLTLRVAQFQALGAVALTLADSVTLADTGAALAAQSVGAFGALAGRGIDRIDATDNVLSLTVAKYLGLGPVALTAEDVVTLADSSANLSGLSIAQLAALAGAGVDRIDATNDVLSLSVAKLDALDGVTLVSGDTIVLADTSAALEAIAVADLAALAGKGVDRIDSSNNAFALTVARLQALGAVQLTAADTVVIADAGVNIGALTPAQLAELAGKGIDAINSTDDTLTLSVAQYRALGTVALTGADTVILADSAANLATLTPAENAALAGKGIDEVQSTDVTTVETALAAYKLDAFTANLIFIGTGSFSGTGNELANTITGGASADTLVGLGGDDTLIGAAGDDFLIGGLGADVLNGGAGTGDYASYRNAAGGLTVSLADPSVNTGEATGDTYIEIERLEGSAFNDTLIGNAGDNTLRGGAGADAMDGGAGFDYASYTAASASVTASLIDPGSNAGDADGDTYISIEGLSGSSFNDILTGDASDNWLQGREGADALNGGGGADYASYQLATAGVTVSLANPSMNTGEAAGDTYISIERLAGSDFNDFLIGDAGANTLRGGLGADVLNGGAGADYASYLSSTTGITASLANPAINTGAAAGDTYISIESLGGSIFDDILIGDAFDNTFQGNLGADFIDGGGGFDYASYFNATTGVTASLANPAINAGEAAGDTYANIEGLTGSALADILTGNGGDNWLLGGLGADQLDGGLGFDVAAYGNATVGVTASLANPSANTGEAAGDTYTSIEALSGSAFNDILIGNGASNVLRGQGGADQLDGGAGNDTASYQNAFSGVTATLDTSVPYTNTGDAAGDTFISIENLSGSAFADLLIGDSGNNFLYGSSGGDILFGGAGNDTFYGNSTTSGFDGAVDRVDYSPVTGLSQGISVTWATGTVVGQAGIIDTDTLFNIESIYGTSLADTFDATGYSSALARAGDFSGYQLILGGGGNDTIIGNNNTEVLYSDATSSVTITLSLAGGVYSGTAMGGGVGTDSLTNVNRFVGSIYNDTFWGTNNEEIFDGYNGGDDIFHGGGNTDHVEYDGGNRMAIDVSLAAGIVTGRAPGSNIGTDTLDSIERIRGSEFADRFDATGFSGSSTNAGSSGSFNRFEGQGGADEIIGNGNTSIEYFSTSAGIAVTTTGQGTGTVTATYGSSTATDTFTGVVSINGGSFADTFNGGDGNDSFFGQGGNDTLQGGGGDDTLDGGLSADSLNGGSGTDFATYRNAGAAVTINLATGIGTGEAAGDTFVSIEGLIGSRFGDNLTGDGGNNILMGNGGSDIFVGSAGNDTYYGNTDTASFDGGIDRVDYSGITGLSQGISVTWATGAVVGQAGIIDTDTLFNIESIYGTSLADTFDATGYSSALARAGDYGGYQLIRGGGGNDTIIGNNGNTEILYSDATSNVTVTLSLVGGVYSGTATGGGIGTDLFTNVNRFVGSLYNDTFTGTSAAEIFDGFEGGDDVFHGGDNMDAVEYDGGNLMAIDVSLAAGIVTGRAPGSNIGTDTLDSIEQIRGSEFADRFDATGFSHTSTNAGSSWDFNRFEGQGGADEIIGNGNTYIDYFNASAGITVTTTGQGMGTVTATYGNNTATDAFAGVGGINGGFFNDALNGGGGNDNFFGQFGNDTLQGGGGDDTLEGGVGADVLNGGTGSDTASYRNASQAVTASLENAAINGGEAAGDSYVSIENLRGSFLSDTLIGNSGDNMIDGNHGGDVYNGRGGMDTLIAGVNADTFVFDSAIGAGNLATIVSYAHGQDHFSLENAVFTQLGVAGPLAAGAFVNGTTALDANDRILFDSATGNVSYDADGSGAGLSVVFATIQGLQGGPLDHTDFLIL
jgi:Ca2+-binding RTX toxin-like protein